MNVTISFQDLKLEIKIRLRVSFAGVNFWLFEVSFFGWLFDLNECLERLSKRALCIPGKIFHMFNFYAVITSKTIVISPITIGNILLAQVKASTTKPQFSLES